MCLESLKLRQTILNIKIDLFYSNLILIDKLTSFLK